MNTPMNTPMSTQLDHLIVAASSLEQGVAWCEALLGVTPGPGGKHVFAGTHNRLLKIESEGFAKAYLEIDPDAPPSPRKRWFGLDERAPSDAPALVHWVARTPTLEMTHAALLALGQDPGTPRPASRDTPQGMLRWAITLRDDGRMLCGGALPTLIQWQGAHPTDNMPKSGLSLLQFEVSGVPQDASAALALPAGVRPVQGGPALRATLQTPRGPVTLQSPT
jgi:hypothetical protein